MNNDHQQHDDNSLEAPERLGQTLRKLESKQRIVVPPAVDDAILQEAKRHLRPLGDSSTGASSRFVVGVVTWGRNLFGHLQIYRRHALPWAVVAASLMFAGLIVHSLIKPRSAMRVEDINRDGRVDILDAFNLAQYVKQGVAVDPAMDLNRDGLVDQQDADVIALHAVLLNQDERL